MPNDTNGSNCPSGDVCGFDVFVRDLQAGMTERVSVSSAGAQGDGDSGAGDFGAAGPAISADGRYVAFAPVATDLVPGDTNGRSDVFVRDRKQGTTERVSVSSSGRQGNNSSGGLLGSGVAISADGRYVAFEVVRQQPRAERHRLLRHPGLRPRPPDGSDRAGHVGPRGHRGDNESFSPALSGDGHFVAFVSKADNLVNGRPTSTPTSSCATWRRARPSG